MLVYPPGLRAQVSSIAELLARRAEATPDLPLYTFLSGTSAGTERRLTASELAAGAEAVAGRLRAVASPGDRALLLFAPGLDYITALFGCLRAGLVPVPAYPPFPGRSAAPVRAIAIAAEARLALTSPDLAMIVRAAPELDALDLTWLTVAAQDPLVGPPAPPWTAPPSGTPTLLQFTSGSTARARGVHLTDANLLTNLDIIRTRFGHDERSVGVIWLPPYHDMGLIGGILEPLYVGFPVYLLSPLDFLKRPALWLEAISRYRATTSGAPDFAYALATRKIPEGVRAGLDLSSWRVAFTGAERVRVTTLERFAATFASAGFDARAFHPCYGLAEATLYVTGTQGVVTHPEHAELVSCGSIAHNHLVAIVNPDTLVECDPDTVGEVWLRGPGVAQGYHGGVDRDRFSGRIAGGDPDTRWLRTSDYGRMLGGQLYIVGRMAARLVVRGRTLQAEDVEDLAVGAAPQLREGRAVAFTREDTAETRLVLLAELRDPVAPTTKALAALVEAMQRALTRVLGVGLDGLILVAPGVVPVTTSGKVRRAAGAAAWTTGAIDTLAAWWAPDPGQNG